MGEGHPDGEDSDSFCSKYVQKTRIRNIAAKQNSTGPNWSEVNQPGLLHHRAIFASRSGSQLQQLPQ
jgi:hypothetical protein